MRAAVLTRSPMTRPSSGVSVVATLAGHDPDPGLELGLVREAVGGDGRDELEAGPDGPLGVVLLGDRRAPDRHDGVADELLDDAPVAGDDGPGELEVAREELSHLLGVAPLRERREADEVAEQHRDMAQLGAPGPLGVGPGPRPRALAGAHRGGRGPGVGSAGVHPPAARGRTPFPPRRGRRRKDTSRHGRAAFLTEEAVGRELRPA